MAVRKRLSGTPLPEGALDLRVRASGPYTLNLGFDPTPADLQTPSTLPVTLELAPADGRAAGYWHEGQQIPLTLLLTNTGAEAQELTVDAVSSDWAWQPRLATSEVTLAPNETADVELIVEILPDVPAAAPVPTLCARPQCGRQPDKRAG